MNLTATKTTLTKEEEMNEKKRNFATMIIKTYPIQNEHDLEVIKQKQKIIFLSKLELADLQEDLKKLEGQLVTADSYDGVLLEKTRKKHQQEIDDLTKSIVIAEEVIITLKQIIKRREEDVAREQKILEELD